MNKTLTISVIALVAVIMGMSSVAIVLPQATATQNDGPHELWWAMCDATPGPFCKVWINTNHNGICDPMDVVITMSEKAIQKNKNITFCPNDDPELPR